MKTLKLLVVSLVVMVMATAAGAATFNMDSCKKRMSEIENSSNVLMGIGDDQVPHQYKLITDYVNLRGTDFITKDAKILFEDAVISQQYIKVCAFSKVVELYLTDWIIAIQTTGKYAEHLEWFKDQRMRYQAIQQRFGIAGKTDLMNEYIVNYYNTSVTRAAVLDEDMRNIIWASIK